MVNVICMGELLVEFVSTADNISLAESPGFIKAPGGAPANVAVAVQRLGLPAGFVGKVGDDPFGIFLRKSLAQSGVDVSHLFIDPYARTTAVYVAVWHDGHKDLCFYRNPGADMLINESEISADIFKGARCFHYGSISFIDQPSCAAQHKAINLARSQGLMITYDPNYRPTLWPDVRTAQTVMQDGFRYCHLAKVSSEEWKIVTGSADIQRGISFVLDQGVELLVISRGERGALVTNGDYVIESPAFPVEVVETTGAGDGFMAAIITKLLPLREKLGSLARIDLGTMQDTLRYANAVGALTCTRRGAIPALPTYDEVERFIHNH
jgi:sugar/nucleoside kinase (ribokinase family)